MRRDSSGVSWTFFLSKDRGVPKTNGGKFLEWKKIKKNKYLEG